jgi:hypothetical protein
MLNKRVIETSGFEKQSLFFSVVIVRLGLFCWKPTRESLSSYLALVYLHGPDTMLPAMRGVSRIAGSLRIACLLRGRDNWGDSSPVSVHHTGTLRYKSLRKH